MKKVLSLLLVGIMVISMVPTVFATTNYTNGTQVQYNAEADNNNDGQPDHAEAWTVTVPALLEPGSEGNVVAQGTWASNRKLVVTADETVTLANSINANDTKTLDIDFSGIELAGSNTADVSATVEVGVAGIENALFGTWSGTFYYQVEMVDNVELISFYLSCGEHEAVVDRIYSETPLYEEWVADPENPGWYNMYGFVTNYIEFKAEENMTWKDWVNSEYNTTEEYYGVKAIYAIGEYTDGVNVVEEAYVLIDSYYEGDGTINGGYIFLNDFDEKINSGEKYYPGYDGL